MRKHKAAYVAYGRNDAGQVWKTGWTLYDWGCGVQNSYILDCRQQKDAEQALSVLGHVFLGHKCPLLCAV